MRLHYIIYIRLRCITLRGHIFPLLGVYQYFYVIVLLAGRVNEYFEIRVDGNCTFVVRCRGRQFGFYNVTVNPGFSDTMVSCNSSTSMMLNRSNNSVMMYDYTVQASDGCLTVVIQGTFTEAGMLFEGVL